MPFGGCADPGGSLDQAQDFIRNELPALLDRNYRVVVVRDAVLSPGDDHTDGIERMRAAGVTLIGVKGLFYEWVRTVDFARKLDDHMASVPVPDGLTL